MSNVPPSPVCWAIGYCSISSYSPLITSPPPPQAVWWSIGFRQRSVIFPSPHPPPARHPCGGPLDIAAFPHFPLSLPPYPPPPRLCGGPLDSVSIRSSFLPPPPHPTHWLVTRVVVHWILQHSIICGPPLPGVWWSIGFRQHPHPPPATAPPPPASSSSPVWWSIEYCRIPSSSPQHPPPPPPPMPTLVTRPCTPSSPLPYPPPPHSRLVTRVVHWILQHPLIFLHRVHPRDRSVNVALRPQRPYGLLGMYGSPGRPPRISHSSWLCCFFFFLFRCCYTSTET